MANSNYLKPAAQSEVFYQIVGAVLDFLTDKNSGKIVCDGHDAQKELYGVMKQRAENYYAKRNLAGLKKMLNEFSGTQRGGVDEELLSYVKEKTGLICPS